MGRMGERENGVDFSKEQGAWRRKICPTPHAADYKMKVN